MVNIGRWNLLLSDIQQLRSFLRKQVSEKYFRIWEFQMGSQPPMKKLKSENQRESQPDYFTHSNSQEA